MPKQPKWREILTRFTAQLRIVSREVSVKPGERGAPLELWNSQRRILDEVALGMEAGIRKFYVLKSRQLGSTTIWVIVLIFWLATHPKMKGALVVDQDQTRENFREAIRFIIDSIPASYFGSAFGIKPKGGDNKHFMAFTNGSQLNFLVAGTSESKVAWGESSGYAIVVLTEVANYGSPDGLANFEEAMSEHNPDRLYVYESTAKGRNHWFKRWNAALADPYTCRCIFVGWWSKELNTIEVGDPKFEVFGRQPPDTRETEKIRLVRDRYGHQITMEQLAWRRWRASDASKTPQSLDQNQPWLPEEAFVVSGWSYFQVRKLNRDLERLTAVAFKGYRYWPGAEFWSSSLQPLDAEVDSIRDVQLRVWAEPKPEGRYVIGCDPAGGRSEKNNCHAISVWRCYADKLIQVAEWADNRCETTHCAWMLAYLAGSYRNCQVILELNGGYGKAVMTELEHIRLMLQAEYNTKTFADLRKRDPKAPDWSDFLSMARYYIYRRPDSPGSAGYILNWVTSFDNKRMLAGEMRDSHINDVLVVNSRLLLEEMMDIVEDGEKQTIGAPGAGQDDRWYAAMMANHAYVQDERPGMIMQGLTFDKVTDDEKNARKSNHIVDRIVAEHFRNYEGGVVETTPERQWQLDRNLA